MPTFTAITLDRLLEPGAPKAMAKPPPPPPPPPHSKTETTRSSASIEKKIHWPQVSPALYATPEPTPLPDSPSSFPPSPYIINHKRRGPRLLKKFSQNGVSSNQPAPDEEKSNENGRKVNGDVVDSTDDVSVNASSSNPREQVGENGFHGATLASSNLDDGAGASDTLNSSKLVGVSSERDCESEDFFDPRESMSVTSSTEVEDNSGAEWSLKMNTPMGDFYDAWEELSSEGCSQPSLRDIEAELREIRLSLLAEIEKRKQAEESLSNMRKHWKRIQQQLSLLGLTLPGDPTIITDNDSLDYDPAEELSRQVYLARFVSNSVGRGSARAEVEMEMEAHLESKNFEIARLCDRLHYYEAMNREMSQRNQEAVDMARRDRQRRKGRQKWFWISIGAVVTLGTAALAWSYIPTTKGSSSSDLSQASEGDNAAKP